MIKGVNRQMIEILDTGNPYFERALLVIAPGMSETEGDALHREAQQMLQKMGSCSQLRLQKRQKLLSRLGLVFSSGIAGALVTLLVERLL